MLKRVRPWEWFAALCALALVGSLFAPWYGLGRGATVTNWESFGAIDALVLLAAAMSIALLVLTAAAPTGAPSIAAGSLTCLVALATLGAIVVRIVFLPDFPGVEEPSREWGLWLALAVAAGLLGGTLLSVRDERLGEAPPVEATPLPPPDPDHAPGPAA